MRQFSMKREQWGVSWIPNGMEWMRREAGPGSVQPIQAFLIFVVSAYLLSNLYQRSVQQDILSEAFDRGVKQY